MAKVKKMAFGGMGRMASGMGASRPGMRQAPMQSRGALGGNQPPAGANLLKAYNNQGQGSGLQSIDPNIARAMQAYQAQPGQGAGVPDYAKPYMAQAGQPTAPPAFKGLGGMGAGMKKGGKVKAYAKGGEVTFLTKDRQEKADNSMKAQRMRERDSISKGRSKDIESSKPGAPYYRADSSDSADEAVVRAKGQGKYMAGEVGSLASKKDEGVLAPAARTLKNVMDGKRGEEATKDTDGDPYYKRRTKEEGDKAVSSYRGAKENQKEYGMKKGGKVSSASSRGDGIATKGKTRGRIV